MVGGRLIWPLIEPVLNATGQVVAGAVLSVYQNRTVTLATIYADEALTTPVANPQSGANASNAAGRFYVQTKAIWLPVGVLYTLRVDRPDGTFDVIDDIQPQGGEAVGAVTAAGSMSMAGAPTLSNTSSLPVTSITASVGLCRDSTNTVDMTLLTPMAKRLDQAWAAGTGSGGRLSGTLGASQSWHVFIIAKADGTMDVGFDQSVTAPTLPAGYVYFRRLGAILTDSINAIRLFVQFGDYFETALRSTDFAATANGGGVAFLRTLSVPKGKKMGVHLYFQSTGTADTTAYLSGIFDPDHGTPPAFGPSTQWAQVRRGGFKDTTGANISFLTVMADCQTDANGNVYTQSSDASELIVLGVVGWTDKR